MKHKCNKKFLYNFTALILCFALILPCFVSCNKKSKETSASAPKNDTSQESILDKILSIKDKDKDKNKKDKKDKKTNKSNGTSSKEKSSSGSKKSSSSSGSGKSGGKAGSKTGSKAGNGKASGGKNSSNNSSGKTTSKKSSGSSSGKRTNSKTTRKSSSSKPSPNAPYAKPVIYSTVASGRVVYSNNKASVDASNTRNGYIMARYTGGKSKVKLRIKKNTTYTYDLSTRGNYEAFPLSMGSGTYTVEILENISGNSYAKVLSQSFGVSLSSSFAPYLRPNQFVNYNGGTSAVSKAAQLCTGYPKDLQKVDRIYNFVVKNFTYDTYKANTVQSGYIPNLNSVYSRRKGICFDYAALMTAMLRSQNIPCKLVVGWASSSYHAWISVYIRNAGWINGAIYFDGRSWKRMDPTFASSANSSDYIMKYIGNGSNYRAQYYY